MLDPEAESAQLAQRSAELTGLLDAGHPVVGGCPDVLAESKRLGAAAAKARRAAAAKFFATGDAGVPVGAQPPVRRIKTDRLGRDPDPFHGAAVVTPELVEYWGHRRDVVAPAVEATYRTAAEKTPYRPALVSAAKGAIALLRERRSMLSEGGAELEAALGRYDDAFVTLRQAANDAGSIATEAESRLASLRREVASSTLGEDNVKPFIANAIASATDAVLIDPATALPLERVGGEANPVDSSPRDVYSK